MPRCRTIFLQDTNVYIDGAVNIWDTGYQDTYHTSSGRRGMIRVVKGSADLYDLQLQITRSQFPSKPCPRRIYTTWEEESKLEKE